MSHLLIHPQNKPSSGRTNPPVSGLYSMHPITKHNYSFPYSYLFQVCGLLGAGSRRKSPLQSLQFPAPQSTDALAGSSQPGIRWLRYHCSVPTCHITDVASPLLPAKLGARAPGRALDGYIASWVPAHCIGRGFGTMPLPFYRDSQI